MKIAIYGAGGVGCVIGARLFDAGAEVTLIARGLHLAVLKGGLVLNGEHRPIPATSSPAEAGKQDAVFLTCKSYDLPEAAGHISPMLYPDTAVIPAGNGLPWWFFEVPGVKLSGFRPTCLDPESILHRAIPTQHILGGLCYMGATVTAPGMVTCNASPRVHIGEPGGLPTARLNTLGELLEKAGFRGAVKPDIRPAIWEKLCWNIAFNPLGVVTGKTCGEMASDPLTVARVQTIIAEMNRLALDIGMPGDISAQKQLGIAASVPDYRTSMQQDHARGKRMETEAIIGVVVEVAARTGTPIPGILELYHQLRAT